MTRRRADKKNTKRREEETQEKEKISAGIREERATNEDLRDTNEDLSVDPFEEGPSQEDESQTTNNDASSKSPELQVPVIERDENGNPISFSCSAAVESSKENVRMTVAFDYQMYFHPGRSADLERAIAIVEGGLIRYIAEVSGLPTSDEDDCSIASGGRGSERFVRRSLRGRKDIVDIIAVGAGDPDKENQIDANCVEAAPETTSLDCVPISGTIDVQIKSGKDDIQAENFVKGSAREWMERYGDYETAPGLVGMEFLGTRTYEPEVGREYVEPPMPAGIQTVPEPLIDNEEPTILGYAFAAALCAMFALSLFVGAKKVKKRCSDSDDSDTPFVPSSTASIPCL
uniref:Uncharacterized protein n=1 Tax=Odontella aurita TaxID=265563 RepID=A0A7S4JBG2_9STRA|mmetsp:Transcript_43125/g.131373  ORF Transcript_43125/g.131373 Transcript_43125/m.131373 type:complete len:345 (+) Transcript_43125:327-1361(+)